MRFIEFTLSEGGGAVLIAPASIVAIQESDWDMASSSSLIFLRNSNVWFKVADTKEEIMKKVESEL